MLEHTARARYGFTLIELLVVISIIAILISILLPALGAARGAAQALECASNQRTVGQAYHMYASDYDNFIVPARMDAPAYWNGVTYSRPFAELISRAGNYSKNDYGTVFSKTGSFSCPAESRPMLGNYSTGIEFGYYHFGENSWIQSYETIGYTGTDKRHNWFHRYDDLRAGHQDVILIADFVQINLYGLDYLVYIGYRHFSSGDMAQDHIPTDAFEQGGGTANVMFADGHVASHDHTSFNTTSTLMTGRKDEYGITGWYLNN
jgi:prepilin-type N-terminal cleavage/methylation domain-containing protein/prepilin-type processing-associated H-X9-DG protein